MLYLTWFSIAAYTVLIFLQYVVVFKVTPEYNVLHPGECGVGCLSSPPLVLCVCVFD